MEKSLRTVFNQNFTEEKYKAYMAEIEALHPGALDFRNAETPVFINKEFKQQMLGACEDIIDVITSPNFLQLTERSIPDELNIPGEDAHPQFIVFDFGICKNDNGNLEPQLIEMQGFPTLYAFQAFHSSITAPYANVPDNYSLMQNYPNPFNPATKIKFALKQASFTEMKVYDVTGREIKTLVSESLKPGEYEVSFNAVNLPSGVYFYRINTEQFTETRKMILVK